MTQPARFRRALGSYPARLLLAAVLIVGGILVVNRVILPATRTQPAQETAVSGAKPDTVTIAGAGQIGPGVWLVGTDVQPGTYRSTGAETGGYCMWSRHNTLAGGPMDGIIASDGARSPGGVLVTVVASDKVFRTRGCAPFQKIS